MNVQPLCEPGLFTSTGAAHIRHKGRPPTLTARLEAFQKANDRALHSAGLICTTNPECFGVEFVKYTKIKEYGVPELLMLEVTILWHCKEGGEGEEKINRGDLRATAGRGAHS